MSLVGAVGASTGAALVKRAFDDIYQTAKIRGISSWVKLRSSRTDRDVARSIQTITKVKTVWQFDKAVSLYEFYYPCQIFAWANPFGDRRPREFKSAREFGTSNVLIQGTAGQGKSIFLRYLSGQELRGDISTSKVPIFCELRRVRPDFTLGALIQQNLQTYRLPATSETWEILANSGRFILLLDGFDEIEQGLIKRTFEEIETLAELYKGTLQIIVSSRPDAHIDRSDKFRVYRLAPLEKDDLYPFLSKICPGQGAQTLYTAVKNSPTDVAGVLTTPLMITLLEVLYRAIQIVPDTVPKFYEELFDVLFFRHDNSKANFKRARLTALNDNQLKTLFSAFCFYAQANELNVMTHDEVIECCNLAMRACNMPVDPQAFVKEMTKTVCLLQVDGFETSFIHRSVAQYYAASFIKSSGDAFAEKFYSWATQSQWELELRFLSQIDEYRFNKYYVLPRLLKIFGSLSIDLSAPEGADVSRLFEYLLQRIRITAGSSLAEGHFVKWMTVDWQADDIASLAAPWLNSIVAELNAMGSQLGGSLEGGNSSGFLLQTFRAVIKETSIQGLSVALGTLRAQYERTQKVIEAEEFKMQSLARLEPKPKRRVADPFKELPDASTTFWSITS